MGCWVVHMHGLGTVASTDKLALLDRSSRGGYLRSSCQAKPPRSISTASTIANWNMVVVLDVVWVC